MITETDAPNIVTLVTKRRQYDFDRNAYERKKSQIIDVANAMIRTFERQTNGAASTDEKVEIFLIALTFYAPPNAESDHFGDFGQRPASEVLSDDQILRFEDDVETRLDAVFAKMREGATGTVLEGEPINLILRDYYADNIDRIRTGALREVVKVYEAGEDL